MRRWATLLLVAVATQAQTGPRLTLMERLRPRNLDAVRQQRIRWIETRVDGVPRGIYRDFRTLIGVDREAEPEIARRALEAGFDVLLLASPDNLRLPTEGDVTLIPGSIQGQTLRFAYRNRDVRLVLPGQELGSAVSGAAIHRSDTDVGLRAARFPNHPIEAIGATVDRVDAAVEAWAAPAASRALAAVAVTDIRPKATVQALRATSTHVLARSDRPADLLDSLRLARTYVAHEWLSETGNFWFRAFNGLGVYEIGDLMPLVSGSQLRVTLPVSGKVRFFRDNKVIAQAEGKELTQPVTAPGAYRIEVTLPAGGEDRPWIYTSHIYAGAAPAGLISEVPAAVPDDIGFQGDIAYGKGEREKLDLYTPRATTNFPLLVFFHGGNWKNGDKSRARALGISLARLGIGVAAPNYPLDAPEAQLNAARAAIAWAREFGVKAGADAERIFLGGHSAGAQIAALAALEGLTKQEIRGVVLASGIYDVRGIEFFGSTEMQWSRFSPIFRDAKDASRFLILFAQHDLEGFALQAQAFYEKLRRAFTPVDLELLPGETHVGVILNASGENAALVKAIERFVRRQD